MGFLLYILYAVGALVGLLALYFVYHVIIGARNNLVEDRRQREAQEEEIRQITEVKQLSPKEWQEKYEAKKAFLAPSCNLNAYFSAESISGHPVHRLEIGTVTFTARVGHSLRPAGFS